MLESLDHARARGAHILAEIAGHASSSDAYHMAAPEPEASGPRRAMRWALEDADMVPEQVDYINAHGTSTPLNDSTETYAIKKVFDEYAYKVVISSTKSMLGHAMGASGSIEALICVQTIINSMIPPTINYENPDPICDLDYTPNHAATDDRECNAFEFIWPGRAECLLDHQTVSSINREWENMKIIKNDKLIHRNARLGGIATVVGLALLIGGMVFTITIRNTAQVGYSWLLLIAGFITSQVGVYFGGRFGRSPRPDEEIDKALKGLDERYAIYHYTTPVSHLLVGPAGVWNFISRHQGGKVTYAKGRWRQSRGGCVQAYLRLFAQEGIGRPDLDIPVDTQSLQKFFQKKHTDLEAPTDPICSRFHECQC